MKRIISVIILLVMVAVVFSACGMGHSHKNDPWTVTPDGHYQICEKSGEKTTRASTVWTTITYARAAVRN